MIDARRGAAFGASLLTALLGSTAAQARDDFSVDLAAGVSAATNPFLAAGGDTEAASAFVEITPQFRKSDEISTVTLRGYARLEEYSRLYGSDEAASLDLDVTRKTSDRLTLRAGANVSSNKSSALDVLAARAIGIEPVVGLDPLLNDVSFIGRRTRTTSLSARIGGTYLISSNASLDGDASVGIYRFKDPTLTDYRYANQQVAYARRLSERTWLQTSVGLAEVDYRGRRAGDSFIVTPLVGLTRQLTQGLEGSLSVGASLSSVRRADGSHANGTGLALRGRLCNDQVHGRVCVNVDRSSQPTALGDVRNLTSIAGVLTRQLSQRDDLELTANASRTSGSGGIATGDRATFVGANARLSREFTPRLAGFVSGAYADIFDTNMPRRANLQGRLGVRYRFGVLR